MPRRDEDQEDRRSLADLAAAAHDEAARISEAAAQPASAAHHRDLTTRVRETLREFETRPKPTRPAA